MCCSLCSHQCTCKLLKSRKIITTFDNLILAALYKRYRKRRDNPEKLATLGTKDTVQRQKKTQKNHNTTQHRKLKKKIAPQTPSETMSKPRCS